MPSRLNPYLSFRSDARAALEFYASVLGGTPTVTTFGEAGAPAGPDADLVMHGQLETPAGFLLMASDTPPAMGEPGANGAVSLSGDDGDDLRRWFQALADSGSVTMPLAPQSWGDEFGMCVDRFGTHWLVNVSTPA